VKNIVVAGTVAGNLDSRYIDNLTAKGSRNSAQTETESSSILVIPAPVSARRD
jgi:hypothetical protein